MSIERNWLQISCQRTVAGAQFDKGVQDYNFSVGGRYAFVPSRSYFRIGMKLQSKELDVLYPPVRTDQIAFADNVCSNLFTNCYFRAGGADVSSIVNRSALAHQVKTRLSKSGAWLNSIGKSAFFYDPDFTSRVNTTSDDGVYGNITQDTLKIGGATATVALTAATGAVVGVNTQFTSAARVGDILYVEGGRYNITTITDDTNMVVDPAPRADIAATGDAYIIKTQSPATDRKNEIYTMWQPPIGIFDAQGSLGAGQYRIQLNPNANYRKACVEAPQDKSLTAPDGYNVEVTDIQFFACIEKTDKPSTGVEKMELMEMQVQSKTLTNRSSSNLLDFTVPPSTKAISIFVQSSDAGSNNIIPLTKFSCKDGSEKNLNGIQLTYANVAKPSTNFTSEYEGSKNFMTQRYLDTQIASGFAYSVGGAETFDEWLQRGPIYHFDFNRDSEDRSTHVQLNIEYGGIEANANVFVVSHYTRVCEITTTNGMISNVASLSI